MKKDKIKNYNRIVIIAIAVLIAAIFAGTIAHIVLSRQSSNGSAGDSDSSDEYEDEFGGMTISEAVAEAPGLPKTIEYDGKTYEKKQNIQTILLMGIDDDKKVEKKEDFDGRGQADVLILLVRDRSAGTYRTLSIDRDTMVDIKNILNDGTIVAVTRNQITLSHIRGDGMELSCEATIDAVSNYLNGLKIDYYAALNMGGLASLNNLAGGVEVTITDDFSDVDPSMEMGKTMTLTDEQAETFVRGRKAVADGSNVNRMARQSAYIEGLEKKLRAKCSENPEYALAVYDGLSEYMVSDMKRQQFGKLATDLLSNEKLESVTIDGTRTVNEESEFVEFEPDEDSVTEAIITLFYQEK